MKVLAGVSILAYLMVSSRGVALCQPECPTDTIEVICDFADSRASSAVRDSLSCSGQYSGYVLAGYDLSTGRWIAQGEGYDSGAGARIRTYDQFVLSGPSPGTPVTFRAQLRIQAFLRVFCGAGVYGAMTANALFAEDESNSVEFLGGAGCGTTHVDSLLQLTIVQMAGEPFELRCWLDFSMGNSTGSMAANLTFLDLPPGSSIVSCQGFGQSPVAVVPHSWGSLKARFR